MPRHENHGLAAETFSDIRTDAVAAAEEIRLVAMLVTNLVDGDGLADERAHMGDRPKRCIDEAVGKDSRRVGVEHALNVGPCLVDLAVDIALQIGRPVVRRLAVEIEALDVADGYQAWSKLLREEEAFGILGITGANVPERIHDAFVQKDLRRGDQLFEDLLARGAVVFHVPISPIAAVATILVVVIGRRRRGFQLFS